MPNYITLILGDLTTTLTDFVTKTPPRLKMEMSETKRSALGYVVLVGRLYEDTHLWEFSAVVDDTQRSIIDAMYYEFHRLRRLKQENKITLIDTTYPFQEPIPRTRATAPSPDALVTSISTSYIQYYAQFYVSFAKRPEYQVQNKTLNLVFDEREVKVTP